MIWSNQAEIKLAKVIEYTNLSKRTTRTQRQSDDDLLEQQEIVIVMKHFEFLEFRFVIIQQVDFNAKVIFSRRMLDILLSASIPFTVVRRNFIYWWT